MACQKRLQMMFLNKVPYAIKMKGVVFRKMLKLCLVYTQQKMRKIKKQKVLNTLRPFSQKIELDLCNRNLEYIYIYVELDPYITLVPQNASSNALSQRPLFMWIHTHPYVISAISMQF